MALTDSLKVGDFIIHSNSNGQDFTFRVENIEYLKGVIHLFESSTNIKSVHPKHWVDSHCRFLSSTPIPLSHTIQIHDNIFNKVTGEEFVFLGSFNNHYRLSGLNTKLISDYTQAVIDTHFTTNPPKSVPVSNSVPIYTLPKSAIYNLSMPIMITSDNSVPEWTPPKIEPVVHKICRQCGKAGSHNIVNHKEYYWCSACKDEC